MEPAAMTMRALTIILTAIWMPPRTKPCATILPAAGLMNCGASAGYMAAAFGLSKFVRKPIQNRVSGLSLAQFVHFEDGNSVSFNGFHASQSR